MKSRIFFRENGHVIRTRSRWAGLAWPVASVACFVGLLAWGEARDADIERQEALAAAQASGHTLGVLELADLVGDAYRQGVRDGLLQQQQQQQQQDACAQGTGLDRRMSRNALLEQACARGQQ